ncbi:hypothetical protein [Xenorhabdus anantnagensis]|uniref:ABC transmembrane type-1 domain-containing protein n=1 Tax=Xenorhabdus anantnagensis TaxID=3025875 RepID=A0ABT5LTS2_9GAMM|nr:hypothetical protein [Xenorhabdus anantnagensis]
MEKIDVFCPATFINIQWQSSLFKYLLKIPLDYFERCKLGDIQSRLNSLETLQNTFTTSIVGAIMDEATSALDKESENYVNQAIKALNITRVIIAYRETTIASVDKVISLQGF